MGPKLKFALCVTAVVDGHHTVAFAHKLGVLRAKLYCLPGGAAWTLTSILAELQTLLVEHSHPKKDVDGKAHEIYDALGHSVCKSVLDSKNPWAVLKSEASKHKLILIPLAYRGAAKERDEVFEADLWANWGNPKPRLGRSKKVPNKVTNAVAKVDLSFFHASKQPVAQVDLNQLLQGHSGLLVPDLAEISSHLPSVLKSNTSVAAAGVLIVGASVTDISTSSSDRIQECIVPGWIGAHTAALKAVLVNCGDKAIELHKEATRPADHQVIQCHVYKDLCEKWSILVDKGLEFFLKAIGFGSLMAITQTWSQSYFTRGRKVQPEEAEYYHGYLRLEVKAVPALLRLGGYDGFFPTPKTLQKTNDPAYRVLQLRGFNLADARALLPPEEFGLTRSRQGFGLRVAAERYAAVKRSLFPGAAESSESDDGGSMRFQLLGVCPSVDRSTLKAALRSLKWPVRVSKASGFRAWTVFSSADPPTRSFPLNKSTVVVIRTDSASAGPVVASSQKQTPSLQLRLPTAAVTAPQAEFPTEVNTKLAQITAQSTAAVTDLEAKVNKLSQSFQDTQEANEARFLSVEQEVKSVGVQVTQQNTALDQKLQTMFDQLYQLFSNQKACVEKLEKSNEQTVNSLRQEYQSGYNELKDILSNSPKTRKVAGP